MGKRIGQGRKTVGDQVAFQNTVDYSRQSVGSILEQQHISGGIDKLGKMLFDILCLAAFFENGKSFAGYRAALLCKSFGRTVHFVYDFLHGILSCHERFCILSIVNRFASSLDDILRFCQNNFTGIVGTAGQWRRNC